MPNSAPRPCTHPGCGRINCTTHTRKAYDQERGSSTQRGYDYRWQKYRAWFIRQTGCPECGRNHALCEGECQKQGRITPAFAVDHTIPHRGDPVLFWRHSNHRSLCEPEHNAKARSERIT